MKVRAYWFYSLLVSGTSEERSKPMSPFQFEILSLGAEGKRLMRAAHISTMATYYGSRPTSERVTAFFISVPYFLHFARD
jgi:hypothetical protein